jgi:hypothetical protein
VRRNELLLHVTEPLDRTAHAEHALEFLRRLCGDTVGELLHDPRALE